jgi:NAD(P)-dependent dehydrogenase (short-subunit alcohol dehydrogenase family)
VISCGGTRNDVRPRVPGDFILHPMPQDAILVTGATSDIGSAICRLFGQRGYHIFAHARDADKVKPVVNQLIQDGASAEALMADLKDPQAPNHLMEEIKRSPHALKVVVNNAGGVLGEPSFTAGSVTDPLATYQVNVFATYSLSILAGAIMNSGSIINISSINANSPWGARIPLYSSAKAAVSHLTKMLAIKLAPNVRVNAVSPGRTKTAAWGNLDPGYERKLAQDQLIDRWIEPEEIADAVWFLAQNRACTGIDLIVDGGMGLKAVQANI